MINEKLNLPEGQAGMENAERVGFFIALLLNCSIVFFSCVY